MSAWYYCSSSHYRKVRKTVYFDADFYVRTNPDVRESGIDPLLHYITRGYRELRQPSAFFDTNYYLTQYPELQENGKDPLLHFLDDNWQSFHNITHYFDPDFYLGQTGGGDISGTNPLVYYLRHDRHSATSIYFDAKFYTHKYRDAYEVKEHPLLHYFRIGTKEKRQPSPYFDVAYYYDNAPDLEQSGLEPLSHYYRFGIKEGKSPCPLFNPTYYTKSNIVQEGADPFLHYITYGVETGVRPCCWFDPCFYCNEYLEPDTRLAVAIEHYLSTGVYEGVYPNKEVADLPNKPVISLVVPVYNVSFRHLNNCIRSVLYQSYPHWELCLVDDCSTDDNVRLLLRQWAARDTRIKVNFLSENLGISGASNAAAALASGSYLGFLDNDDELAEECLFTVVQKINSEGADLYYSDEDLIGEDGSRFSVFAKPDYNKELLLSHNYITHLVVVEKDLYDRVGGFDPDLNGAQDFDLFLKLSEQARSIVHIPEVLYHWRASETSTSINHDQKDYADEAGRLAIANALKRREIAADVLLTDWKFFYRIQKEIQITPRVAVLIVHRNTSGFDDWFSMLLTRTTYPDTEFIVVVESKEQMLSLKETCRSLDRVLRFVEVSGENCLATNYNAAARESSAEYIIFLNAQVQLQTDRWVEALLQYGIDPKSGMVGGRVQPFSTVDFIETVPDLSRESELYYSRFLQRCSQHMNGLQCVQNVLALSWDLAMVERKSFIDCDGFDEDSLGHLLADTDFCFRLRQNGYENIYTPHALGRWLVSEETQNTAPQAAMLHSEKQCFQKRWQDVLKKGDPYYNIGVLDDNGIDHTAFFEWYAGL